MLLLLAGEDHEGLLALTRLIESGQVAPHVESTYPLDRAAEAVARLHAGGVRGKLVVSVSGG